jgi:hypothetical protein
MAIMPTRSFPPGAISDVGDVCPNATADKPASNAIERRTFLMCIPPESVNRKPYQPIMTKQTNGTICHLFRRFFFVSTC